MVKRERGIVTTCNEGILTLIKGSEVETLRMKRSQQKSIEVVWSESYDSHAFMLEQIISKLEQAGYASREEIMTEWGVILSTEKGGRDDYKQILKKAIQKTQLDVELSGSGNIKHFQGDVYIKAETPIEFIFSHYFAKAFWGEDEVSIELENVSYVNSFGQKIDTDNCYGFGGIILYPYEEGGGMKYQGKSWKYHLQQMVLEEEPLKYIERFL